MVKIIKSPIDWVRCCRFQLEDDTDLEVSARQGNLGKLTKKALPDALKGRFWVDGVGICYVADSEETATKEALNWQSKFYEFFRRKPHDVSFALVEVSVDKSDLYCDIRGLQEQHPELYEPDDYSKSQKFAKEQHKNGENGIIYDSVRHTGGECAAVFTEDRLKSKVIKGISLHWDGEDFSKKS